MSLNYDTSKCAQTPTQEEHQGEVFLVCTYLMAVDMNGYDDGSLDEFLTRIRFYESLEGNLAIVNGKSSPMPVETIRKWSGITTNVPPKTRDKFITRIARFHAERIADGVAHELS